MSTWGGWVIKQGQNLIHVVCECPLRLNEIVKQSLSRGQKPELKLESAFQDLKSSRADFNGYGEILLFRGSKIFWQFSTLVDALESKDFWIRI